MKYSIYGFKIYKKTILLNLILSAQIFLSILLMNMTLGKYNMQMQSVQLFSDLATLQGVYYMPADVFEYMPEEESPAPAHDRRSEADFSLLRGVESIGGIQKMAFLPEGASAPIDAVVYSDNLIEKFPAFFNREQWFPAADTSGEIPVVVVSDLYGKACKSGKMTVWGSEDNPVSCMVDVRGLSSVGNKYLSMGASGEINCMDLFPLYNDRFKGEPLFLTRRSAIQSFESYVYHEFNSRFIFYKPDISPEDKQFNEEQLQKTGSVKSFAALSDGGIQEARTNMLSMLSITLCLFVLSLVGAVSMVILSMIRFLPVFSIYYICGCRWISCVNIILMYLLYVFIPVAVGLLAAWPILLLKDTFFHMQLLLTMQNVWLSLGMILTVLAAAIVPTTIFLKKYTPIQILHHTGT